jgi:serine/threonine protein kinase
VTRGNVVVAELEEKLEQEYVILGDRWTGERTPKISSELLLPDAQLGAGGFGTVFSLQTSSLDTLLRASSRGLVVKFLKGLSDETKFPGALNYVAREIARSQDAVHRANAFLRLIKAYGCTNSELFTIQDKYDQHALDFIEPFWSGDRADLVRVVAHIGTDVATGLHLFHEGGGIHRDLKPWDIGVNHCQGLIEKVLITDLGQAHRAKPSGENSTTVISYSGRIIGHIDYLCDEILRGANIEDLPVMRIDGFALGMVMKRLLTRTGFGFSTTGYTGIEDRQAFLSHSEQQWAESERALHMVINRLVSKEFPYKEIGEAAKYLGIVKHGNYACVLNDSMHREAWTFRFSERKNKLLRRWRTAKRVAAVGTSLGLAAAISVSPLLNEIRKQREHEAASREVIQRWQPYLQSVEGLAHRAAFAPDSALRTSFEDAAWRKWKSGNYLTTKPNRQLGVTQPIFFWGKWGGLKELSGKSAPSEFDMERRRMVYEHFGDISDLEDYAEHARYVGFDMQKFENRPTTDFTVPHIGRFASHLTEVPALLRSLEQRTADPSISLEEKTRIGASLSPIRQLYSMSLDAAALALRHYNKDEKVFCGVGVTSATPDIYREHIFMPLVIASVYSEDRAAILNPRLRYAKDGPYTEIQAFIANAQPILLSDLFRMIADSGLTTAGSLIDGEGRVIDGSRKEVVPQKHEQLLLSMARRVEVLDRLLDESDPWGNAQQKLLKEELGNKYHAYEAHLQTTRKELHECVDRLLSYERKRLGDALIVPVDWTSTLPDNYGTSLRLEARVKLGMRNEAKTIAEAMLAKAKMNVDEGLFENSMVETMQRYGWLNEADVRFMKAYAELYGEKKK